MDLNNSEATQKTGGGKRFSRWLQVGICLALVIVCVFLFVRDGEEEAASDQPPGPGQAVVDAQPVASTDARPIAVLTEGFTSSTSCRDCHEKEHRSWHASYHRTMTQIVDAETAPSAIRDHSVLVQGDSYGFEQDGDRFFVTFRDPLVAEQFRRRELLMMTGSHHMHVFWYESGFKGTPALLPIVYLKDEERWIPRESAFLRSPDLPKTIEFGRWNETCCRCHSTRPRQRAIREAGIWDTHVVEFGIACEACHGQGEEHARRHASKNDAPADLDQVINPQTVSARASADVCGQCHSIYMPDFDVIDVDEFFQHGNPFKPGQLLSEFDFTRIVQASPEHRDSETYQIWSQEAELSGSFWADGMVRVSGREYNGLIESPCYQHGDMTCLSCHTMHPSEDQPLEVWRDDQLKPGMRGDQACLQCHADYAERITEHTHHAADSHGSRCQNCHMPYTTYGLLKTLRSHEISSPSIDSIVTTDRPSACALCHLDRTNSWVTDHLHEWYGQQQIVADPGLESSTTSAAVLHFLKGDAAQRAVQAAAFGWQPAQEASGTEWMEPILLVGANDPYDAIRIISARSLRSLPNRISTEFDVLGGWQQRVDLFNRSISEIDVKLRVDPKPEVLIDDTGVFDFLRAKTLIEQRDQRPIYLRE